MEELIKKLAKPIAEISDRAVLTINSKLSNRVTTIEELLEIENSIIAGLVLHWINERQTHANINTLHAALKILQDIALVPKGHYSLVTLGCIEFLNSYYNHVPTSLQTVVSGILNSLVTPSFKPIERQVPIFSSEPEIPTNIYPSSELPTFIKPKQHSKIHIDDSQPISIQEHCEYPPVLLCDSDEKLLFDICVLIKFGNTEEMIESCNDVQYSILLNYPVDSLLQRPDIIRSVVSLANAALSKGAFEVTHKALKVMESILIKLDNFSSQINKAEYRAASCTPKKALIPVEHIGISVPCLKNEQWEVGTPGLTLSVLAACELIITGIPLNEGKLVGVSIKTWEAGLWALPKLLKYPRIVKNILENIGNALKLHSESNKSDESSIIIKSILELSLKVIFMLPPNKISEILSSQSSLVQYIADLIVFQGENCDEIIPYLEEIDKQVIKEYDYAKKCVESLEASIKIKQMLAHEKLLPITSPQMLHNAIDFFGRVMPILEFQQDLPIQNFVLDLNVYSFLLENDSNMASRFKDCQDLLLALLSSPIELVRQNTIQAVKSSVTDVIEMKGIAQGILRNQVIKKFLLKEPVIGYIVVNCPELHCVIPRILEKLEDYGILLPYFTVLQGLSGLNPDLGGLVHTLTNQEAASQPLRFIRDLFSKNPSNRILASQILRKCNSPDTIQSEWLSTQRDFWESGDNLDVVSELEEKGELEFMQLPSNNNVTKAEMLNLLNILKSESLEKNLKVAAAEQVLIHLLSGTNEVQALEEFIVSAIQELRIPSQDDRVGLRLVSNCLEILVVIALNYPQQARKIYQSSVKFVCSLVPFIYSAYRPIRFYSLYLIYILAFSNSIQRNSFIQSSLFNFSPQPNAHSLLKAVQIVQPIFETFLSPFPIQVLKLEQSRTCKFLEFWQMVPSSERVHNFVFNRRTYKFDVEFKLDEFNRELNQAETHGDILKTMHRWENLVLISKSVNIETYRQLLKPDSGFFAGICAILRVPPTSKSEDQLYIHLLESLIATLNYANPSCSSQEFDYIQTLSILLQRSMLPFLTELIDLNTREHLISSIMRFAEKLLIHHGCSCSGIEGIIKVLSRFQVEPGKASLLSLLERILQTTENLRIYETVISVLILVIDNENLKVSLDITTSPQSQYSISSSLNHILVKLIPFTSPTTFVNKHCLKKALQLFIRIPEWIKSDSYIWALRLTEDREVSIRTLAWCLLWKKSIEVYNKHSTVLDSSLDVIFAQTESYGVKTQACAYLCSLTEALINSDDSETLIETILKSLYQYGILSHIKNLLFENAGPHPAYFGSLVSLLYNIVLLDYSRVSPICIQLDIWDPLIRLLRPGALLERLFNEQRKPCKESQPYAFEDTLIGLINILNFITHMMKQDSQITDYLLESTHILAYAVDWIQECADNFEASKELVYSKTLQSLCDCLHIAIYQSPNKAKQAIQVFKYELFENILDITRSKELKLTICRLLSCLLSNFEIEDKQADRLVLHLINIYKENINKEDLSAQKEAGNALTSLLFYSKSAKTVACSTGFAKDLAEYAKDALENAQITEVNKNKKSDDGAVKELIKILAIFKLWAANSTMTKLSLSTKDNKPGPLLILLFNIWPVSLRKDILLSQVLETLCTLISDSEDSKSSCALVQENRQSILSFVIEYLSRPSTASDHNFRLALKMLGSLCICKETRQLLIKSKYPQGLGQRLVKIWNECKDPQAIPVKSPFMLEFLATFAFFEEGQKAIAAIPGLIDVLVEVLDRYTRSAMKYEAVEASLLLLRNLCFSVSNKPHVLANSQAFPLLLAYVSSSSQKPKLRSLASSALWALLYHHQKVKAIFKQENILRELENVQREAQKDAEKMSEKGADLEKLKETAENLNSVLKICIDP